MTMIAEKLKKDGLVTPKAESNGENQNQGNQSGSGTENGGEGEGGNGGGESSTNSENNESGQGGNSGGQQEAGSGTEASGAGGSGTGEDDLDDEAVVRALHKRGIKVGSLKEITIPGDRELTEAEKHELEIQRMNSVRAYALNNKLVTSTDFDDYARESTLANDDLALSLYKKDRIAEEQAAQTPADQMPTDEQLEEEFNDLYFRHAKDTDPKRKQADKHLQKKVDEYLQTKYSSIYGLEEQFDNHQTSVQQRTSYDQTVEGVIAKAGKEIPFKFKGEDQKTEHSYPVVVTDAQMAAAKAVLLSDKTFRILALDGDLTPEVVGVALNNILIEQNRDNYLSQVVHAHTSKVVASMKKGRREIFNTTEQNGDNETQKPVNKNVKAQLDKKENKQILNKK